ncbi:unnamed protein product [Rangifer tarandus platyrhynchus]|uniref:Uncharacterized protein n=1 Tax=Rangifer tarandus platyrhynchus TaxID=3082113 RepID=A0AC59Z6M0_RANTA
MVTITPFQLGLQKTSPLCPNPAALASTYPCRRPRHPPHLQKAWPCSGPHGRREAPSPQQLFPAGPAAPDSSETHTRDRRRRWLRSKNGRPAEWLAGGRVRSVALDEAPAFRSLGPSSGLSAKDDLSPHPLAPALLLSEL